MPVQTFVENGVWIIFNKRYKISGYGKNRKEAEKMFKFCVDEYLKWRK